MGYTRHHAIIVTGWDEHIYKAHDKAERIFSAPGDFGLGRVAEVTPVTDTAVNSYQSFMVAPDGSKEGWDHSDKGNTARDEFIEWLEKDEGYYWAEVQFGDEDGDQRVLRASNKRI